MEQRKISQINQCIERIRAGDRRSAVEDLYDLMGNQIRFIALRYTHDSDDADDLVQDFWLNVCRYCDKYRVGSNGYFFLCKTFSRDCLDWLKRKEREPEPLTLEDIEYFESLGREDATESRLETMELHDKATAKMTERERLIYSLTIYEGLSIRDASRELNISKSSGARLFRKALEKVKVTLIEMGWDKNRLSIVYLYGGDCMKHTHKRILVATPIVIAILLIAFVGAYAPALSVATAEEELHYGAILSSSTSTETVSYASYTEETYHDNTNFPSYYNTNSSLTNVCAPVAGADVIGYFDRNYTNLIPSWNPGYTSGSNYQYYPQLTPFVTYIQGVISALYTQMGTNTTGDGTTRAEYQAGLTSYVQNAGYSISFSNSMSGTIPNVSTIKTQLQAGKVVTLYLNGYTYTTPTLTSTAATYSHTTYTGTHVAIAYGYRIIRYYNSSGVNFRTDTLLKVATGQSSAKYAYMLVSSSLTTFVAADVTNVY